MEKMIKLNDTLRITNQQWFPIELNLDIHLKTPYKIEDFQDKEFEFKKPLPRIFCLPPTRVFLVQEIDGKWIKRWHCLITEQTIFDNWNQTKWKFKIIQIYEPEYIKMVGKYDTPKWKNYFEF